LVGGGIGFVVAGGGPTKGVASGPFDACCPLGSRQPTARQLAAAQPIALAQRERTTGFSAAGRQSFHRFIIHWLDIGWYCIASL
jgi:hypothetical protein